MWYYWDNILKISTKKIDKYYLYKVESYFLLSGDKVERYKMEHIYPRLDSVTMCKVLQINEYGLRCEILENWGNNLEGELLFSQLTRKKIRAKPSRLINIGKIMPLRVIDINVENCYISLSKIDVNEDEKKICEEKYGKYKTLYNILYTISNRINQEIGTLYNLIVHPLFRQSESDSESDSSEDYIVQERNGEHPLDVLIRMIEKKDDFGKLNLDCDSDILLHLEETIKSRIQPKLVKLVKSLVLNCFNDKGINVIKEALFNGEKEAKKLDLNVEIYLDAPPKYIVSCETYNSERDEKLLEKICEKIEESMIRNGGEYRLEM